ncbi:hypothetical protein GCM10010307_23310 [Streptomyces vastus]|uniref:Uncharacterized protein n=1 Tax=Streptomyces vastus TaxID=285451 RepID=A0ABP6CY26_9ACTN
MPLGARAVRLARRLESRALTRSGNPVRPDQPRDRYADGISGWIFGSVVLLGIQQCQGVADSLFEEFVGKLPVRQGTGELQRPGQHAEEAE